MPHLVVVVGLAALAADATHFGVDAVVVLHVVFVRLVQLERLVAALADEHLLTVRRLRAEAQVSCCGGVDVHSKINKYCCR